MMTESSTTTEAERRIRERAYQLWQADGPEGKSDHYWHLAEGIIEREASGERSGAAE